jgi:hypothetical protein
VTGKRTANKIAEIHATAPSGSDQACRTFGPTRQRTMVSFGSPGLTHKAINPFRRCPFRNPLGSFPSRYKPFTPRRPRLAPVRAADSPRVASLGFAVPVAGEGGVVSWRRRLRVPSRSQGSHPFLFSLSMLFDPSAYASVGVLLAIGLSRPSW